jgi:hypothetical protein
VRAAAGFVLLDGWLGLVGWAALRALGVLERGTRAALAGAGPAFAVGVAVVVPSCCVALVLGIPLTPVSAVVVGLIVLGGAALVQGRPRPSATPPAPGGRLQALRATGAVSRLRRALQGLDATSWLRGAVLAAGGVYVLLGAWALARAPTRGDDARIWSLRGLTLSYYHVLQPEIFQNPVQSGGHAVYPLLTPALQALLSQAMGTPQLRLFHAELWLLAAAALWTAGFLVQRYTAPAPRWPLWLGALALLAMTPFLLTNLYVGDADAVGSLLLGAGAVAVGLWLHGRERGCLVCATILLAGAASTKDESLLAAVCVLLVAALALSAGRGAGALPGGRGAGAVPAHHPGAEWLAAAAGFVAVVAPWRVWLAVHHLSDAVQPPLPRALSPAYLLGRHRLHRVVAALLDQALRQWGWLLAIFVVCVAFCLVTPATRRVAGFYLAVCAAIGLMLTWLYTATPLSLDFLIPTSMDRTVSVFMVPAAVGTAHLLALQLRPVARPPDATRPGFAALRA